MDILRVVGFLVFGVIVLIVLWSVVMKEGKKTHVAIEEEKKAYQNRVRRPTQAQVLPGDLVKIVDADMSANDPKLYTFYYAMEPHKIGIGIYNKKYVFMLDDQMFLTYTDIMGHGTVHNRRFASISEKFTITEVVSQTTNQKYKIEELPCFEKNLVEDTSTHYNDQVEFKEER